MSDRIRPASKGFANMRRADQGACARRRVLGARGLLNPRRDSCFVLSGGGQKPVQPVDERRVRGVQAERSLDVGDGRFRVGFLLRSARQSAQFVGEGTRVGHEAKAGPPRARRLAPAGLGLVQPDELVENATVDGRDGRGARGGSFEEIVGSRTIAELPRGDHRSVELETCGPRSVAFEGRFFVEEPGERPPVRVRGDMTNERFANGTDARVQFQCAIQGAAGAIDAIEPSFEDAGAFDVQPSGELRVLLERVGHSAKVDGESLPILCGAAGNRPRDELALEAFQRSRVVWGVLERLFPGRSDLLTATTRCLEKSGSFGQKLYAVLVRRGRLELAIEVFEHGRQERTTVRGPPEDGVGCRRVRGRTERCLRVHDRSAVVAENGFGRDGELEARARQANLVVTGLEMRNSGLQEIEQAIMLGDVHRGACRRRLSRRRRRRGRTVTGGLRQRRGALARQRRGALGRPSGSAARSGPRRDRGRFGGGLRRRRGLLEGQHLVVDVPSRIGDGQQMVDGSDGHLVFVDLGLVQHVFPQGLGFACFAALGCRMRHGSMLA